MGSRCLHAALLPKYTQPCTAFCTPPPYKARTRLHFGAALLQPNRATPASLHLFSEYREPFCPFEYAPSVLQRFLPIGLITKINPLRRLGFVLFQQAHVPDFIASPTAATLPKCTRYASPLCSLQPNNSQRRAPSIDSCL